MAILIKLLAIKIVASNFLGLSLIFKMSLLVLLSSLSKRSKSLGDREKYATSDPDIKAEQTSRKISNIEVLAILKNDSKKI